MKLSFLTVTTTVAGLFFAAQADIRAETGVQRQETALSLYGLPTYPPTSSALAHTSANARKGGRITLPAFGTFDTLNPYSLKGLSLSQTADQRMWGIDAINETLMVGGAEYLYSPDEPATAYCLVCKTVEYDDTYTRVTFNLEPAARFHDGSAMTSKDVEASFKLLTGANAHPRFADIYRSVTGINIENPHRITFYIEPGAGRQIVFRLGELPVMSAKFWQQHRFGDALLVPPLLSGPYQVCNLRLGHTIDLCRVENFWSKNHFFYRNQFNFDRVRYDFFRDRTVAFEAFKSGRLTAWVEYIARNWATAYDFPALARNEVIRQEIPHQLPASYQHFAFNLRRAPFDDPAFRRAMELAFDFEWTNKFLFNGAYKRTSTYFPNSLSGAKDLPDEAESALLKGAGVDPQHPMFNEIFKPSQTDGSGNPRPQLKAAMQLLKDAGFILKKDTLYTRAGKPVKLEFLTDHPSFTRVIQPYRRNLLKLGIQTSLRSLDESQYKKRIDKFDYDVIVSSIPQNLIPSQELRLFFHSSQANKPGSYNYPGIANPVVDSLLDTLKNAGSLEDIRRTTSALDRVLLWNHYTIPQWYLGNHRIAFSRKLKQPGTVPPYSLGFAAWWHDEKK